MSASTEAAYSKVEVEEERVADRKRRSQFRQYLVCIVVNTLPFVGGTTYAWIVPMMPVLQSEKSPFGIPPISDMDASWLASITSITRVLTIPMYGYVLQRFGHKVTSYLIASPFIISWALLYFANSVSMLFWSRFITGLALGGVPLVVPSYAIDIAEDNIKGRLSVLYVLSRNVGCTVSYIMGSYTSFAVFHITNLLMSIIFIPALIWMPESPLTLMTKGKEKAAKEALRWLRNGEDSDFELERTRMRAREVLKKRKQKVSLKIITEKCSWRALLICMGLLINQQFCGAEAISSYTLKIFQESGTTIPPTVATIVIGVLLTIGSLVSSVVIEKFGRRMLLISSNIVMAACLIVLAIYLYFRELGRHLEILGWLPVVCLSLYILGMSVAVGTLPMTLVTEMVSPQARNVIQGICMATRSVSMFAAIFTFMPLVKVVGQHGCYCIYAVVCIVSAVCIFFTLPETKNRSIEDVVKQLKSDDYIRSVVRGHAATHEEVKLQCKK